MIKKGIVLITTIFLTQLAVSGFLVSCQPCGSSGETFFRLGTIIPSAAKIFKQRDGVGVSVLLGVEGFPVNDRSTSYDSLGILVEHELLEIAQNQAAPLFNGFTSLNACSPSVSRIILDRIADIDLVSDADYNADFSANQSLKGVFLVNPGRSITGRAAEEFLMEESYMGDQLWLTLSQAPDAEQVHNFTIIYTLTDGQKFEGLLESVTIRP